MANHLKYIFLLLCLSIAFSPLTAQDAAPTPPKGFKNNNKMKLAYAVGKLKLIDASPDIPEHITTYKDLLYKNTDEKDLKLDIYHRKDIQEARPLLIFIHGGSWKKGDKDDYRKYLVDYAEKGYTTATIAYRFSQEAPFPAAFEDVVCALQYLKSHAADYFINPDKIAVIGGSAGGHLAMLLGFRANDPNYESPGCVTDEALKVQAVVNLYGPADLTTDFAKDHPTVTQFVGTSYQEHPEAFEAASPLMFLSEDDPPLLMFHGTIDEIVPVSQADALNKAMKEKNMAIEYHRLKGWPHTMDMGRKVNAYCQYYMDQFFEKYLK